MERAEWLKKTRTMAEMAYDHFSPNYWVKFGMKIDATHREFMEKFLGTIRAPGVILDAACGAGLYDAMLSEAGHSVLGIDQSGKILERAREVHPKEQYPNLRYFKIGLQEMNFQAVFDGAILMDAIEHICPEDWPVILKGIQQALKPGAAFYITIDPARPKEDQEAYERARAMNLPVVMGEIADELEETYQYAMQMNPLDDWPFSPEKLDHTVYHFHPSMQQVQAWFEQAGLEIVEEAVTDEYVHVLAKKREAG